MKATDRITELKMEQAFAKSFLNAGPPYIGDSRYGDKEIIKENGGRWNGKHKKWEARSNEDLKALIASKLWLPTGVTEACGMYILRALSESYNGVLFDRRDPKNAEILWDRDVIKRKGRNLTFVKKCDGCNVLLDSRLQFGLECDCAVGFLWKHSDVCREL